MTKITYNGKTTELADGYIATLPCKDLKMETDVVVEAPEGSGGGSSSGGAELNIAYGDTAPEDTSKLWVKTTQPSAVKVSSKTEYAEGKNVQVKNIGALNTPTGSTVACSDGTNIYVFGGFLSQGTYGNLIQCFNIESNSATTLATCLPLAYGCMGGTAVDGKMYLFGGWSSSNVKSIVQFDTDTQTISTLSVTMPNNELFCTATAVDKKIYVTGSSEKVYCFDTETQTISTLSVTSNKQGTALATIGKKVYMIGGGPSDKIVCLDTETMEATTLSTTLPRILCGASAFPTGTDILIVGGQTNSNTSSARSEIYKFSTIAGTVTKVNSTLPTALSYMASTEIDGVFYLLGGQIDGSTTTSAVNCLAVESLVVLATDKMQIFPHLTDNTFNLINTDTAQVEIGVNKVYKGNADGIGEEVEAALHNGTSWVTI